MRSIRNVLAGLIFCGFGLATGCHDDDCEVRTTRVYHEPAPVVYQSAPVYSSPVYYDRPRVHVHNRHVDVRVGSHRGWHRPVRVRVNRDWD